MTPEDRKLIQQLRDAAVDLTEAYNEWYGVYLGKKTNENPYKEFIAAADAALSQPASEDARPAPEGLFGSGFDRGWRVQSTRIAELEAQLEAATKRRAKDTALLSGFVDALEEIAGSSSLTATPKQFAVHLQRIAKNSLLAAAKALGEK